MNNKLIKIAFGSVPKDGGTFTFYRNLRPELLKQGIDMHCVTVGAREANLIEESYVDDGCVLLASSVHNIKKQSLVFAKWCETEYIDIVIATNSAAILSALPHLAKHIRVVSRCASGRAEGYRLTLSGRERLLSIIALTPRLSKDLINDYCVDSSLIELIPNGIYSTPFVKALENNVRGGSSVLQLGFLGRLHEQKGVFSLPEIVDYLHKAGVKFHLNIAGKGAHRKEIEEKLMPFIETGEVEFVGSLSKDSIPAFLSKIDVFLFTSHFEGCPNALLEAMMAGCVPVSFMIEGIVDFIIQDGGTGFIVPMSDSESLADRIVELDQNRDLLRDMSIATAESARASFDIKISAAKYIDLFSRVMTKPLPDYEPLPWSSFRVDPVYRRDWSLKSIANMVVRKVKKYKIDISEK